jgi:polysaccharide biosynthesis transport protein
VFDVPLGRGVSELLKSPNNRPPGERVVSIKRVRPNLDLLTSGRPAPDPSIGVTNETVQLLFARLRTSKYEFVLLDLPPLLAVAETQLFVPRADALLLVSRVGHTSTEQLTRTRELLDRLSVHPAGVVVFGTRDENVPTATPNAPGSDLARARDARAPAPASRSERGSPPPR